MWNIWAPARRNLLVISAFALCSLPMYGQTANTGAIAGTVSDISLHQGVEFSNQKPHSTCLKSFFPLP